jgi:methylmalonyl-CoA/ethylmalonyl-CoA epimerase
MPTPRLENKMTEDDTTKSHPSPLLQKGIAQIAILVKDLEATVENYQKVFGIGPWDFYTYAKPFVREMSYHGHPADYKIRIALSQLGPIRIELIEVQEGDSIYADYIREHGFGVHHLGVLVEDMPEALNQAGSVGLRMIQDGSGFGADGDGHYAYLDTEQQFGVTFELIERPRVRMPPEKIYPPNTDS